MYRTRFAHLELFQEPIFFGTVGGAPPVTQPLIVQTEVVYAANGAGAKELESIRTQPKFGK
jgi:hypothetical protein